MDKKELLKNIAADSETEAMLLKETQRQLEEEISKPFRKRDYNKIEELTSRVRSISESREAAQLRDECGKKYLHERINEQSAKKKRRLPASGLIAALCCLTIVLGLNMYSFSTFGTNIITAVVKHTQGGISLDFSQPDSGNSETEVSEADSYGIKEKCLEYGVDCAAPEYIPEGFVLDDFMCEELSDSTNCIFYYSRGEDIFNLTIEKYKSSELIPPVLIPNEESNVREEFINGNLVYVMNENENYTAVYSSGDIVYLFYTSGTEFEEIYKVIKSME